MIELSYSAWSASSLMLGKTILYVWCCACWQAILTSVHWVVLAVLSATWWLWQVSLLVMWWFLAVCSASTTLSRVYRSLGVRWASSAILLSLDSMMTCSLLASILRAAWQGLEALMSLAFTFLSRFATLWRRLSSVVCRDVDAYNFSIVSNSINNACNFIELGGSELLYDILELRFLNQGSKLIEALSAWLHLLDLILRAIQVWQDESW